MTDASVMEQARAIADDDEARLKFQLALLPVSEEVAEATDKLIASREAQRRTKLRLHAADSGWRTASTLRRLRTEKGYGQKEMAKLAGTSAKTIWLAEQNPSIVSSASLARIAHALGVTVDVLKNG